jgi:hypothetical protein
MPSSPTKIILKGAACQVLDAEVGVAQRIAEQAAAAGAGADDKNRRCLSELR